MDCAETNTETKSIVKHLLEKSFSKRTFSEKLLIIQNGRPCPKLSNLKSIHKDSKREYVRSFNESQYGLYPWLAGCDNKMALYCWPCLLFSRTNTLWNTTGLKNLNTLRSLQKKHKQSTCHLECVLKLASFGENKMYETQLRSLNSQHNLQVKKNRDVLKRLIDVICFLANQDLPFRSNDGSSSSSNQGNYVELLNLLKHYDPMIAQHFETATVFKATSIAIQKDLIKAIGVVLSSNISQQLKEVTFVAIIVSETTDFQMSSQLSVVFRYFLNGKINEIFVGFIDVSAGRTVDDVFKLVKVLLEKYEIQNKLVAQTYDGRSVMSGHLNELQVKVKEICPQALFVHCSAHVLNLVFSQGLSNIRECRLFFSNLNSMITFASHSSNGTSTLKEFLKTKIPSLATTRWCFSSRLINVVETYKQDILEYFQNIYDDEDNIWESNNRMIALGYLKFLKKFETVFLLKIFSDLYSHSDFVFNTLQNPNEDINFYDNIILKFQYILRPNREYKFDDYWQSTTETVPLQGRKRSLQNEDLISNEINYKLLFYEVIDNLKMQVSERLYSLKKLKFFNLLTGTKIFDYDEKTNFPNELIKQLTEYYPEIFEFNELKNELTVIHANSTKIKMSDTISTKAKTLTLYDVLLWLESKNVAESFPQVYALSKLVYTIPASTCSVERSSSALKRIKKYLRRTQGQERLSDLAVMSVEKEMLIELKNSDSFYDLVIEHFLKIELRLDFIFK